MTRQGLSMQAIRRLLGFDRKTVRKYLIEPVGRPEYPQRAKAPGKREPFRACLDERMRNCADHEGLPGADGVGD